MGYKNKKKYYKDLHQQAYEVLKKKLAIGESKKQVIQKGTAKDKIFSYKTYKTYWGQIKYFISYVKKNHPECKNLKYARQYVREWLKQGEEQELSAWTIHTEAKAVGKLFDISVDDPDYYQPPQRRREDIKRSRITRARDKHFSVTNNDELIRFCKGVGARREGMTKMRGKDLRTREELEHEVECLTSIAKSKGLTEEERKLIRIDKDALSFTQSNYFVYLREKGGRERISPIVGPDIDAIVARFRERKPEERVWLHVNTNADIHAYRADYSNRIYRMYARPIEEIPYDKYHAGIKHMYQSEVYHCRKDEKGRLLDKRAMRMASIALGHNRIEVVANNYLRGL